MTDLIGTPLSILAAVILYIICTTLITRYAISGGKSTKEIIESNKLKAKKAKDFLNKYPEANIKSGRNFALAFGFIFAFASSIYAFSIIGERQNQIIFKPIDIDSAAVIQIQPPLFVKKSVVTDVPPPPPPITHPEPTIKKITDDLPDYDEPKELEKVISKEDDIIKYEAKIIAEVEPPTITYAEKMPRFKGCENLDEHEAYQCTMSKIQNYITTIEYPSIAYQTDEEGKVYISFVIDQKGQVTEVELLKGAHSSLNKAALTHIKRMPTFANGGKQGGRKVKVKFNVPINFQLH